jgi:hypothetical protein
MEFFAVPGYPDPPSKNRNIVRLSFLEGFNPVLNVGRAGRSWWLSRRPFGFDQGILIPNDQELSLVVHMETGAPVSLLY